MEYLMTYGWALLVIIVVAAALFALGVLNPATYQQKRCNGLQYFIYEDQQLTPLNFTIQLRNSNQEVTITQVAFAGDTPTTFTVKDEDSNVGATIQAGEKFIVWADAGFTPSPTVTSGTSYSDKQLNVTYSITGGIAGLEDKAACVGTVA